MRISYLGPEGTYSEAAALGRADQAAPEGARLVPFATIPAAVGAVEEGDADEAVVPMENSLEGVVTHTADLLIHRTRLTIRGEIVLPIHHCLVLQPGLAFPDVRVVYSHPQALAQCRGFLARRLPNAEPVASLSTAGAVGDMQESERPAGAISSLRAAELFGAEVAALDIEDVRSNKTRFVVLGATDSERTGRDKTSICFDFREDAAGILHGALGELATRNINMTRVESRPDRRSLGRYFFLIDVEGHREDPVVREALAGIRARASIFKVLGSYPRGKV
ncbi:MAG: prephenate dehydratase [Gemmatimonadetes bacterium]|nr:prephenate dehydratase [Gemmatimonadota bacterium]MYE69579.1 prephenate dehydratase [Gemmatimonadota bacterium]MYJ67778.1 prephenate dehydratase [Gemmatimonadota bacterium]